nr:polysaccharide pyruvyl transferase family protein [Zhihengliuella flava]
MTSLAQQFDVRTYGRGWEIPDSITVSGEQTVQALKAGRIHVNFPLTRAGFINIKCGVFESAGQGALVATGRFDEMAKFFTYDEDIVGYESKEELAEKIQWLLDHPDEYDRIAENGFRRVITEHLYEHRWMELFARLADLTEENSGWLSDERRHALRETLSVSHGRAKKVIVSGFYGARNLGDEMILGSITQALTQHDDSVQVVVAAENPANVEASHGLQAFQRTNHVAAAHEVQTASAVIVGGGGLWHDYTYEAGGGLLSLFNGGKISMAGFGILPMMGRVLDRPYHVVGLGVGPLDDYGARQTVKFLAEHTESLYVRDPESARVLQSLPVAQDRITVGPDVVYGVDLPQPTEADLPEQVRELSAAGRRIIALNMRPWKNADMDAVSARVAAALRSLADQEPIAVVGVPMQAGKSFDGRAIELVTAQLGADVPVIPLTAPLTTAQLAAVYRSASALVAMRLHACLVAHRLGLPTVGLCYDPKVRRHFEEVGRPEFGLPLEATAEELAGQLLAAVGADLPEATHAAVRELEAGARRALSVAATSIADSRRVDAVYTVPEESAVAGLPAKEELGERLTDVRGGRFQAMQASSERVELPVSGPGAPAVGKHGISVALPTTAPQRGMSAQLTGQLRRTISAPAELCFRLTNDYANPKATGRLFYELTVGDHVIRRDLAEGSDPVIVRYLTPASADVPITLRVFAEKKPFSSSSWPRVTRVHLSFIGSLPLEDQLGAPVLMSTAGDVRTQA